MSYTEYTVKVYENKTVWLNEHGKRHRLDGPAIECVNGGGSWFVDGKRHRLDGPAIEYADGSKAWYIDGKRMSKRKFNKHVASLNNTCEGKVVEIDGKKYRLQKA